MVISNLYLTLFSALRLKTFRSNFRITKLTKYDICDSLAILCFPQTESLWRRYTAAEEKFCSGKHTESHLNRKCKDNESTIQYARPLCLPRIAKLYSPANREKPFSDHKIPSTGKIVFLIDIQYKATISLE